ncbi:putative actin patch protein [Septoria linicola]|nr:putative actin patch protein [Septoria linicola]
MAYTGARSGQSYTEALGLRGDSSKPGARRKKLAGYLKTANDFRQSYFSQDGARESHSVEDGPGAFPDAAVVRSGNEEMILFPSYARHHVKSKHQPTATPGREMSEEEYWRCEWDRNEDINAIVDVDVRGWIYTPAKGQHTRKQRMVIGLARQLSGIPAPATSTRPGDNGYASQVPSRASSPTRQQDEDLIALEADNIIRKGQHEERYAQRGAFSEQPSKATDNDSLYGDVPERGRPKSSYASSITSQDSDSPSVTPVNKRQSWSQPGKMTSAELAVANAHLLARLKPFMASPLAESPISAFFYNEKVSRQQTVYTDASGHFSFRAALDFVPTHVRVLASEKLSATEEVHITAPEGVSLISDIDDTIKHSAISAGAREIFRNAFIRELHDLTIEGVREWYTTLADMGVKIHYVSNSPWQMYPVLTTFFKMANLPKGSFHLKQYSGMLQGIFEPAAERKKGSLEKIMRDFPERRFVLVGDSGEADLEVYSEVALANPGRVLGIFIRDVTTSSKTGYFDSNSSPGGSGKHSRNHSRHMSGESLTQSKRLSRPNDIKDDDADLKSAIAASLEDMEAETRRARRSINPDAVPGDYPTSGRNAHLSTPRLPSRPQTQRNISGGSFVDAPEEDLIDFSDPAPSKPWVGSSHRDLAPPELLVSTGQRSAVSPSPPPKPAGLKSPPPEAPGSSAPGIGHKSHPPRPRKPSSAVVPQNLPQAQAHQPSPLSQVQRQESTRKPPPPLPERRRFKGTIAKAMPMPGSYLASNQPKVKTPSAGSSPLTRPMTATKSFEDFSLPSSAMNRLMAPPPPRREGTTLSTYSTTARQKQNNRMSGAWPDDDGLPGSPGEGVSKKEYLWQQRWQRAKTVLERNGVTLRTWRTGADVADVCVKLVEQELRRIERGGTHDRNRNASGRK